MLTSELCGPALIYLCFSLTQIIIDSFKGYYNTALFKLWIMIIITVLLNTLCLRGLGTVSWMIVFIPFFAMSVVTSLLLYYFGLDPKSGKITISGDSVKVSKNADATITNGVVDNNDNNDENDISHQESKILEKDDSAKNNNFTTVETSSRPSTSTDYNYLKEHCKRHNKSPYKNVPCPISLDSNNSNNNNSLTYSSEGFYV